MIRFLALLFLVFSIDAFGAQNFCKGKKGNTFYCLNDKQFQHCTGFQDGFVLKSCPVANCVTRWPAERNPCVGAEAAAREDGVSPPIVNAGVVVAAPQKPAAPPVAVTPAPAIGGNGQTCIGGPKFDIAGVKNVGNGVGQQFIGGQCLSGADCASGCCAGPCGICSGPGAQFQAGKTGCGFGG